MNETVTMLLNTVGENHRYIKVLLQEKSKKISEVQTAMDQKARTKTPLDERQQQQIHEFTGAFAREGGILQESLMRMESTLRYGIEAQWILHIENTEAFLQSLMTLHCHQRHAIHSLRQIIAFSDNALSVLH